MYWFKDGKQISKRSEHYRISRDPDGTCSLHTAAASLDDDGNYTIMAGNPAVRWAFISYRFITDGNSGFKPMNSLYFVHMQHKIPQYNMHVSTNWRRVIHPNCRKWSFCNSYLFCVNMLASGKSPFRITFIGVWFNLIVFFPHVHIYTLSQVASPHDQCFGGDG